MAKIARAVSAVECDLSPGGLDSQAPLSSPGSLETQDCQTLTAALASVPFGRDFCIRISAKRERIIPDNSVLERRKKPPSNRQSRAP